MSSSGKAGRMRSGTGSIGFDNQFLTVVLPSEIEDCGDCGVSYMFVPGMHSSSPSRSDRREAGWDETTKNGGEAISNSSSRMLSPLSTRGEALGAGSSLECPGASTLGEAAGKRALTKPTLETSKIRLAPPSEYIPEASVEYCMSPECNTAFSFFRYRYRCKMCGHLFCSNCCCKEVSALSGTPMLGPSPSESMRNVHSTAISASFSVPPSTVDPDSGAALGEVRSTHRVCNQCYYETQLVIPKRQENGELRRRCRGEFKLFQRSLLLNIFSFLTLHDLAEVSRVSTDFYFISRDNVIWYQHNVQRWMKESQTHRLDPAANSLSPSPSWQLRSTPVTSTSSNHFQLAPLLEDVSLINGGNAIARTKGQREAISLHARYNYTQFLDYTRRLEMAQLDGLTAFTSGTRVLFSSAIKLAVIGPSHVGKTASIRSFIGEKASTMTVHPTVGFTRYTKMIKLKGDIRTVVSLHIYDVSGAPRFEQLRRLICKHAHCIALCYDPTHKKTLVQAADIMMAIESALGPQPVVICGLLPGGTFISPSMIASLGSSSKISKNVHSRETEHVCENPSESSPEESINSQMDAVKVRPEEAKSISVRGQRSLHVPLLYPGMLFQEMLQCLIDRMALATIEKKDVPLEGKSLETSSSSVKKRPKADQAVGQGLLNLSMQPSPLDILLDT